MKFSCLCLIFCLTAISGRAQNYTSYFTGNPVDLEAQPSGGVCLMGGATEDDNAMRWFLQRSGGGDILVLRATGSNGYNTYLYSELGVQVNSVETIVCNNLAASSDPYVLQKIDRAEAIWFAGGNQWTYISYWRNSPVSEAVNRAIRQRNVVIGGTSAGMAIQGSFYFSAQTGTVTSSTALGNPFGSQVAVDSLAFIRHEVLSNTITDTHFDNPDRRGRLTVFLARIFTGFGTLGKAIACEEYTAVCIDTNGVARVFGNFPARDDNAWFVQSNCGLADPSPEDCSPGSPLTWNHSGQALKAYQIKGDANGSGTFNLRDWKTGSGGLWFHWSAQNGVFASQAGTPPDCPLAGNQELKAQYDWRIYPNPASHKLEISFPGWEPEGSGLRVYRQDGRFFIPESRINHNILEINTLSWKAGLYWLEMSMPGGQVLRKKLIKQ